MDKQASATRLSTENKGTIGPAGSWLRLLTGLVLVFLLFQAAGQRLGSDRGQAGIVIAGLVLAGLAIVERSLFGTPQGTWRVRSASVALTRAGSLPRFWLAASC